MLPFSVCYPACGTAVLLPPFVTSWSTRSIHACDHHLVEKYFDSRPSSGTPRNPPPLPADVTTQDDREVPQGWRSPGQGRPADASLVSVSAERGAQEPTPVVVGLLIVTRYYCGAGDTHCEAYGTSVVEAKDTQIAYLIDDTLYSCIMYHPCLSKAKPPSRAFPLIKIKHTKRHR